MEADWEIEIGRDSPALDASWAGFVNLRANPERIEEITEARQSPALASALLQLNSSVSPLWTAKCDLWIVDDVFTLDPDEMEATSKEVASALACYIDVLPGENQLFASLDHAEQWSRNAVTRLRLALCRCSRVDLVVREAYIDQTHGFGVTVYISACGADEGSATSALSSAISVVSSVLCTTEINDSPACPETGKRYNRPAGE